MILDPMTPERFAEIRRAAEHWRFGDFSLDIEELIDALELERARLDWHLEREGDFGGFCHRHNVPPWGQESVTGGEWRAAIDAAMAREKGAGK